MGGGRGIRTRSLSIGVMPKTAYTHPVFPADGGVTLATFGLAVGGGESVKKTPVLSGSF